MEFARGRKLPRLSYGAFVVIAFLTVAFLFALVVWTDLDVTQGTFVGSVVGTLLAVILIAEIREDREMQHRPIIVVDIDSDSGSQRRDKSISSHNQPFLNVRNRGQVSATGIRLEFSDKLLDDNEEDIMENPVLRDGIRLLSPRQVMSIALHKDTDFFLFYHHAEWVRADQPPPPTKALHITVTASYRNLITGRSYKEQFDLLVAPHVHGWVMSDE